MLKALILGAFLYMSPILDSGCNWVALTDVSVTYYHPMYDYRCRKGLTPSGLRCVLDADVIALGPRQLNMVRDFYGPSGGGSFPRLSCLECEPDWWGHVIMLCSDKHCGIYRVADTGSIELEADLPRLTFSRHAQIEDGRFDATLFVFNCKEN